MNKALGILAAAATLVVLAWLVSRAGDQIASGPESALSTEEAFAADAAAGSDTVTKPAAADDQREPVAASSAGLVLRGRCVDASSGSPLAGCVVRLRDLEGEPAERNASDVITWRDRTFTNAPSATTGGDGVFAFKFVAPSPLRGMISVRKAGKVSVTGRWSVQSGHVDLGEVPIRAGILLSGRVVDTDGVPQDRVLVTLHRMPERKRLQEGTVIRARSLRDGTFASEEGLVPGTWVVRAQPHQIEPETFEIKEGHPTAFLPVVVRRRADIPSISGIVRNDAGEPVVRANLWIEAPGWERKGATSDRDGHFQIERAPENPDEPVKIAVSHESHEHFMTPQPQAWGTKDLDIVLRRGIDVDVLVTDADTGRPVEEFGVYCFPDPPTKLPNSNHYRLRDAGRHAAGRLRLRLRRGHHVLLVQPVHEDHCASAFRRFEVTDNGARIQHAVLPRRISQLFRVVDKGGRPVAGSDVQLVRPMEPTQLRENTSLLEPWSLYRYETASNLALLLARGETDARGELRLSGPAGQDLALRVLGDGHRALVLQPFVLRGGPEPLKVEVSP